MSEVKKMNESKTLFGEALRDAFQGKQEGDFLVCSDDAKEFPLELSFYLSGEPERPEVQVLSRVSGRILDLGCGCGRILKYLQDKGLDVTGLDIDPITVEVAEQRGCRQVYAGTPVDLDQYRPFDTILLLDRTLCAMGTPHQITSVLSRCHACSASHAQIIFDSIEVSKELAHPSPGIMQDTLRFKYKGKVGKPFVRTFFSASVARDLAARTGWELLDTLTRGDRFWMTCRRK